jgi:hypothetical protein
LAGIAWLSLTLNLAAAEKKTADAVKPPAAVKIASKAVTDVPIPKSTFEISAAARNPFFPNSAQQQTAKVISTNPDPPKVPEAVLILNGLTGPPKRTAMINGRTFEAGEEAEVRLPSGSKQLVKCEEIKDNSAIILVAGQRRELRLREVARD